VVNPREGRAGGGTVGKCPTTAQDGGPGDGRRKGAKRTKRERQLKDRKDSAGINKGTRVTNFCTIQADPEKEAIKQYADSVEVPPDNPNARRRGKHSSWTSGGANAEKKAGQKTRRTTVAKGPRDRTRSKTLGVGHKRAERKQNATWAKGTKSPREENGRNANNPQWGGGKEVEKWDSRGV